MDIKKISPSFSVSSQLTIKDLGLASSQGFKTVINNRPDGESDDQPSSAEFARVAQELDSPHPEQHALQHLLAGIDPGSEQQHLGEARREQLGPVENSRQSAVAASPCRRWCTDPTLTASDR